MKGEGEGVGEGYLSDEGWLHLQYLLLARMLEEGLVRVEEHQIMDDPRREDVDLGADSRNTVSLVTLWRQVAVRARAVRGQLHAMLWPDGASRAGRAGRATCRRHDL